MLAFKTSKFMSTESERGIAPPKKRYVKLFLSEAEFTVMNWLRFRHEPARLPEWAHDALVIAARKQVAAAVKAGRPLPQGVAEALNEIGS